MSETKELVSTLERVEQGLERNAAWMRELGDRVTTVEQRVASEPEARFRAMDAESHKARTLSGDADRYGITKVHNARGEPAFIVGSKARVADALKPAKQPAVSLGRFLAAGLIGTKCGDREALEYVAEFKNITTGTSGLVVPAEYAGEWIDKIRDSLVLVQAGAQTVPMSGKTFSASALTGDPTAEWHSEGGTITASDPTFATRTLTAQTLAARCTASVEATQDSPNFGEQLATAMSRALAVEIDRVGLVGSGTPPEPQGILNVSGINAVATVGTISSYAKVLEGVQLLLEDRVPLEDATKFAIMSPRTWARFENLATGITSDKTPLPRPRSLENMQFLTTTAVPNTLDTDKSALFLGDFRDVVLGIRTDLTVEALRVQTYAEKLLIEFVGWTRVDWVVTRPASLCALTGIA